jgi:hypothetical protein
VTPQPNSQHFPKLMLLMMGVFSYPSVKVIGYITFTEIILIASTPVLLLLYRGALRGTNIKTLIVLGAAWLCSAIISDLYRGAEIEQFARGWARVIMLVSSLMVTYSLLVQTPRLFSYYAVGLTASAVIVLYYGRVGLQDYEQATQERWQNSWTTSYVYVALNAAVAIGLLLWRQTGVVIGVFLIVGATCVFFGSRALGAVLIMAALTMVVVHRANATDGPRKIAGRKFLWYTFIAAGCGALVIQTYAELAVRGYLGESAQAKYIIQSQGRFGIVLSARTNVVGAVMALTDSPFVGFGSWAEDRGSYFYRAIEFVGYDPRTVTNDEDLFKGRIPTHSYILEAWVEHGLLAAFFWVFVLVLIVRAFRSIRLIDPALLPAVSVYLWLFLWNIFFSPLGSRPVVGASLAIILCALDQVGRLQYAAEVRWVNNPRRFEPRNGPRAHLS